jgi:hypothetical protein
MMGHKKNHQSWLPVNGKEERQRGNRLLSTGQIRHGLEPLPGRHTVVVDPLQVGLLRVLRAQEGLRRVVPRQRLVDTVDRVADVLETLVEEFVALLLDALEVHLGLLGLAAHVVEVLGGLLQLLAGFVQLLHGLHVRGLARVRGDEQKTFQRARTCGNFWLSI